MSKDDLRSVPITQSFDHSSAETYLGQAYFNESGLEKVEKIIEKGGIPEFAVAFVCDFIDEGGVYKNVRLVEISMIVKGKP